MPFARDKSILKALLATAGSALLLLSCGPKVVGEQADTETIMTQRSDTLTVINSENGIRTFFFEAPLMEEYGLAREPYREFRRGVYIETYGDSSRVVESTLEADYAIFWERQKLWEAKGNVVAVNAQGSMLETQQLFWNQTTKRIYSNVDTRLTRVDGVITGVGFESDESLEDYKFRRTRGKMAVDTEPTANPDSVASANPAAAETPVAAPAPAPQSKPQTSPKASPQRPRQRPEASQPPGMRFPGRR